MNLEEATRHLKDLRDTTRRRYLTRSELAGLALLEEVEDLKRRVDRQARALRDMRKEAADA